MCVWSLQARVCVRVEPAGEGVCACGACRRGCRGGGVEPAGEGAGGVGEPAGVSAGGVGWGLAWAKGVRGGEGREGIGNGRGVSRGYGRGGGVRGMDGGGGKGYGRGVCRGYGRCVFRGDGRGGGGLPCSLHVEGIEGGAGKVLNTLPQPTHPPHVHCRDPEHVSPLLLPPPPCLPPPGPPHLH